MAQFVHLRTHAQKLWGFAKYLATPLKDRIPENVTPFSMDPITSRDRFLSVLPDPAVELDAVPAEYASIELSFRRNGKVAQDKAIHFRLLPDDSLPEYASLFDPSSYKPTDDRSDLQDKFIAALKEFKGKLTFLKDGAETYQLIVETYQHHFQLCEKAAAAELLRATTERERFIQEQNEQLKAQQEQLTQQLAAAKKAVQQERPRAGKTLPVPAPVTEARAVAPAKEDPIPPMKTKVTLLPFLPVGTKTIPRKTPSPTTRASPSAASKPTKAVPVSAVAQPVKASKNKERSQPDKKALKEKPVQEKVAKVAKVDVVKLLKTEEKQVRTIAFLGLVGSLLTQLS